MTTVSHDTESHVEGIVYEDKPEGPIAAAIIAAGIGALVLGILTMWAEAARRSPTSSRSATASDHSRARRFSQ